MLGALTGFVTIGVVIGVGILVAHLGLFDLRAQQVLARLAFYVGSPCLMALTIAEADVAKMLSANLIASAGSVIVAGGTWIVLARLLFKSDAGETTIGALSSAYVNAGNLGIPIAAYALGDAALVAPTLLMQLIVIQPLAMVVLDRHTRGGGGVRRVLVTATTNPLTIGSILGLLMALTGVRLPTMIHAPVELLAELAVPAMLLGYGIALRLGPGLGAGLGAKLWATCTLKLIVQPLVAYVIAAGLLGAQGVPLLAIVVTAALPTAQNIFVHATRYDVATGLARDTILLTTLGSVPVILLAVLLLS